MILARDRAIASKLIAAKLWRFGRADLFGTPTVSPCWGTRWLFDRMRKRQTRDGLHHAPACHANEWSGMHLVVMPCTCGAARMAAKNKANA